MLINIPEKKELTPPPPMPTPPPAEYKPGTASYEDGDLFLTETFDNESITPLIRSIIDFNKKPEDERPPVIRLYINSPGGAVHSCFALIDTMKASAIPVHTIAFGYAASCAFVTLMAGKERFATENAMLMSHVYSTAFEGRETDIDAFTRRSGLTTKMMLNHYKKCTGKSVKYIREHLLPETDVWLTAEEAKSHGVIDTVITTY